MHIPLAFCRSGRPPGAVILKQQLNHGKARKDTEEKRYAEHAKEEFKRPLYGNAHRR
jgi:hypothetical protein